MTTHVINNLAVEVDGEGDAVLCIHGLGGSSNVWEPLLPALQGCKVIRPDLPGSARSALPAEPLSIALYVTAMVGVLDELKVGKVHVLAHSMGTIVAQHLAEQHPERVLSLALFGPLVAPPDAARSNIEARASAARGGVSQLQEIANAIVNGATSKQTKADQPVTLALVRESVMRQTPEGYAQSCEALARAQAAQLESIQAPVLLVTGDQDGVAPPASVEAMSGRLAHSRHVVVEGCGHWTTYEHPDRCVAELQRFFQEFRVLA